MLGAERGRAEGTGHGLGGRVQWTEVEVIGGLASPRISLHGKAQQRAAEAGGPSVMASASWAGEWVIAIVAVGAASAGADCGRDGEVLSP